MYCLQDCLQYCQSGHVHSSHYSHHADSSTRNHTTYITFQWKAYTFDFHNIFLQFPIPRIFLRIKNPTKSELWNIFSKFFVLEKPLEKFTPTPFHLSIWAWSSFDKGPALSITTLRCLRGAVMHPPRRGRRNIHSRAWPQWRGEPVTPKEVTAAWMSRWKLGSMD